MEVEDPVASEGGVSECRILALGRIRTSLEACELSVGTFGRVVVDGDWRQRAACFVDFCHCVHL